MLFAQRLVDLRAFAPSALMAIDGAPPALLDGAPSARLPESEAGVKSEVGVESEAGDQSEAGVESESVSPLSPTFTRRTRP